MTSVQQSVTGLEIAIIGMAGRFPGAASISEFWHNLTQSVESIGPLDEARLLAQGVTPEALADPNYVKVGGVLADTDQFDAAFFGYSPREAELLDPQQRIFLETAWEALETSGYDSERFRGSIGVYGGAGMNGYLLNLYANPNIRDHISPYELFISNDKDFLTTRVSYKLNLQGPSLDVQTACSSSLVAVHLAGQALLSGECDLALAGGVAISKQLGYRVQAGSIYAADGHCRAFDAKADGTVGGNGVGIVVLKRLEEALKEGDTIEAVIKGSAINNDGAKKVSYTAPSIEAQKAVIQAAQTMAEVESDSISYIEAHGTGTDLGDPIELAALTQAFNTDQTEFCALGSVKTNIGHLDAAAGIAGLIKTVLALKHQQIPASLHFQEPNPNIDFNNSPFYVNTTLTRWTRNGSFRRAGVSSFGIGGTNAHVVLEEAPVPSPQATAHPQLLIVSAKTPTALETASNNLVRHLDATPDLSLADVAWTLQMGRRAFPYRRAVVCNEITDAITQLKVPAVQLSKEQPTPIFLFPGQGSQYPNMAKGLYETQPIFRQVLDQCAALLELDHSLLEILASEKRIIQTQYTQPALFAVEYALAQLWQHWGLRPKAMLGHSIGEYVAACLAGVFDLETALRLVTWRGQLMQQQPHGAMLSVALAPADIRPRLKDALTLAATNGPQLCVVSGSEAEIATFQVELQQSNISCCRLHTSHAFHSPLMELMIAPFVAAVGKANLSPPTIPFISNVTGTWITPEEATDPGYWGRQARQTVHFSEGVTELLQLAEPVFLEVGPGQTLTTLTRQHFSASVQAPTASSLPHPKAAKVGADLQQLFTAAGQVWSAGVSVAWDQLQTEQHRRVPLPTYPFERQRYWVDLDTSLNTALSKSKSATITLEADPTHWFYRPSWQRIEGQVPQMLEPGERPRWLIFADELGLGQTLAQKIEQTGQDVFTVKPGHTFEQTGYRQFDVSESADSYRQLLDDLNLREMTPTAIVYLWPLDREPKHRFMALLNLLQTWSTQSTPLQITVVTTATYDVVGSETLQVEPSIVQGLCQVVSQEYPHIGCRQVDLLVTLEAIPHLAQTLWQELQVTEPAAVTAYRGRHCWWQKFQSLPVKGNLQKSLKLRSHGVYAIVGDFKQGLGSVWAQALATHYQAKIVLLDSTASVNAEQDRLLELGATEVLTLSIDLNQAEALQASLAKAAETLGTINGVFFSSPTTNEQSAAPIALLKADHWSYCEQTKVQALQNLAQALEDFTPDFCCVQSSLSSVIGGIGLAAYAGANHFIDTFVIQQNQHSNCPWFSINWDAWSDGETATGWGSVLSEFALTSTEVWTATERILTQARPGQIIVSKGTLQARIDQWIHAVPRLETSTPEAKGHHRPQIVTAYVAPRNQVEKTIAAIWQDLLGLEQVGIHDSFFDLGGHSLLAIQVIARLREAFPVEVEMRNLLFESPTVAGIAAVIAEQLPPADDLREMASLLEEVKNLSSEEVQAQLAGGTHE